MRNEIPLALIITALPGSSLDSVQLPPTKECDVWQAAGKHLRALHTHATNDFFGRCDQDGNPIPPTTSNAMTHVSAEFDDWMTRGLRNGFLSQDEQAVVRDVRTMIPAFAGERPFPCHRDYCPANWIVSPDGEFLGVIDFEFAYWDVRMADFSRHPEWEWIHRPDLIAAFMDGYERPFTQKEEEQRLVSYTLYALGAIVWGMENEYFGFAKEGREALVWIRR